MNRGSRTSTGRRFKSTLCFNEAPIHESGKSGNDLPLDRSEGR